ncbi:hypothetical protein SAMN05877753_102404 [Bacillus oleivorans]|uniref:Uncharacterized protein n=1 Tax=Bacillus oleivorans TaxID=1448271 RepID=A0A285CKW9_9BACI|nr:hypothetical protein [Bacillus oleivorans]SNX68194.1 hypothetical protein SAMN05877753_102404 [Bacillus oleivorans]
MKHAKYRITIAFLLLVIGLEPILLNALTKPNNSLELYQYLRFSDDFDKARNIVLNGEEKNFSLEDYQLIKESDPPIRINQYILFQYAGKTILIETTPGTKKLEIIRMLALPNDIEDYFRNFTKVSNK